MKSNEIRRSTIVANGKDMLIGEESDEPPGRWQKLELSALEITGTQSEQFLHKHFPHTSLQQWNNWHWQLRNAFTSLEALSRVFKVKETEHWFKDQQHFNLPLRITPYYAGLLDPLQEHQALQKSVIPTFQECIVSPGETADPLSENHDMVVPGIVHRYPDRVLFLATSICATYCRYCTRSHLVACGKNQESPYSWQPALDYIREHKQIRDVLISGGDVLTLADTQIDFLLSSLRDIPHVEIIRIGTKVPMVLPQRITSALTRILKKYHPLFISIHATHPDEFTPESSKALQMLADAGIPLGSQTVLLKDINDDPETMQSLMHHLLKNRVRPYYLYQCDPVPGSAHFRTPVSRGLEILASLIGHTSGYAVPHFVIDTPGGGGKIPLLPDSFVKKENGRIFLRNYEGKVFSYPDID